MTKASPPHRLSMLRGALRALGLAFIGACAVGAVVVTWRNNADVPPTLTAGGLEGRAWSSSEVTRGIGATAKQLRALDRAMAEAERKGDFTLALDVMAQSTKVLSTWNDQVESTKHAGRNCWLAAMHLSTGAQAVANGQAWAGRSQFESALADCKP